MSIAVAIINHNQDKQVKKTVDLLMQSDCRPEIIYIISDSAEFKLVKNYPEVEIINTSAGLNIYRNRNIVINKFLSDGIDQLVFIDGDCYPANSEFLKNYELLLDNYDLVYGTRFNTDISKLKLPESDILLANMDNLFKQKKTLNYSDIRLVFGIIANWRDSKKLSEKCDMALSGMAGCSDNFGITRKGLKKLLKYQKDIFGMEVLFDTNVPDCGIYEDTVMCLNAIYAGLDINITDGVRVTHVSHNRETDIDYIKIQHMIMEHYRMLENSSTLWEKIKRLTMIASAFFTAGLITGMVTYAISIQQILGQ